MIIPGMAKWRVYPDEEPAKAVRGAGRPGRARRRLGARHLPRAGGRSLADLLPAADGRRWSRRRTSATSRPPTSSACRRWSRRSTASWIRSWSCRPGPASTGRPTATTAARCSTKLKAKIIPAILVPEHEVAFQILALNTEKAHNLKEKSLEVIRMYRGLVEDEPQSGEEDYAFQFESPHFITLGLLYEQNKRFAGGAFAPILRRVDKFLKGHFPKTLKEREERAALVRDADEALGGRWRRIKKRGINHPYVKNFVLARTTPLTRAAQDAARLRADLQEARRQHRGLRRRQGALRGHPALGHHGRARGGLERSHGPARPSSPTTEVAARLAALPGLAARGRQAPPRAHLRGLRPGLRAS